MELDKLRVVLQYRPSLGSSGIISAECERFQLPPQTQQQGTLEAEAATLRCLPTELTCILCHSLAVPS